MSDAHSSGKRVYEVHVGKIKLRYENSPVKASRILEDANFLPPSEYILEALRGDKPFREYDSAADVDLEETTQYRAIPRGGGRA